MERYNYKITKFAYADIDQTLKYISEKLSNPKAVSDLLDKVDEEIQKCRDFPYSYPDCTYYFIESPKYRHIQINNYVLFFRVNDEEHTVEILRFLFAGRDFSKIRITNE